MATSAQTGFAGPPAGYSSDQAFFRRMAVAIALFIVFAFAQWSARGFVDLPAVPWWVHVHGLVFVSWLALFVTQNLLAERGSLALHRKLGWTGVGLAVAMVAIGMFTGFKAIELHRVPPFFSNAYFLALTNVGMLIFGGMVVWAIARRREVEWHRRLMLGATILLLEPALGRLLPMPLLGPWGQLLEVSLQLGVFMIAIAHDRRVRGAVHPALKWGVAVLLGAHLSFFVLEHFAPFIALADGIAGA